MRFMAKMFLGPGELVVARIGVEDPDHRMTIRMLINVLFWGIVAVLAAVIAS
jgi:hypothetical protein